MADLSRAEDAVSPASGASAGTGTFDRISSFRITYLAIFAAALLYVVTLKSVEVVLDNHFRQAVSAALEVNPGFGSVIPQMQRGVRQAIVDSPWTRLGEVRVDAWITGADGSSIYNGRRAFPLPIERDPIESFLQATQLLPARADVVVSVPQSSVLAVSILLLYGSALVTFLFLHNRNIARREQALIQGAIAARDATASRAERIEGELESVRGRLRELEPAELSQTEEIRSLQRERESLQAKQCGLAEREAALRDSAARAIELEGERHALEELLDEATEDLSHKEEEIHTLEDRLKRAAKTSPRTGRSRATEQLGRRLRTLYKNIEFDDRAVQDLIALGDEGMRLKAEEAMKRLTETPDNSGTRRKVGGLPSHLSVFELGFAGKGRIYYTRGRSQRLRILTVGAKNTQNTDLEYLSRLPAEES